MAKIKILVVEDEVVIADNICNILEKLGYDPIEPAINYSEAIQTLKSEQVDLALLDIQLAGSKDGVELAKKIKSDFDIPFIFLTSNADPQTVERAKHLNPPAYLVKPFNKDDLYTAIEMALFNYSKTSSTAEKETTEKLILKDAIFIKDRHLFHKVKLKDILIIKSDHVYIELYTKQTKKYLIRNSMSDFIRDLPEQFFRVHRSYAINLDHLDAINSRYVIIQGEEIPIGKSYRDDLMSKIEIR